MWDAVRDWGLAVLALLGAVTSPILYVANMKGDLRVANTKIDAMEKQLERMEKKLDSLLINN